MASTKQLSQMKSLIYKTLLKMERMNVNVHDYLDELYEEFETEDSDSNSSKPNRISLLTEEETDIGWGVCDKGHTVHLERGMKWTQWNKYQKRKCKGCHTNQSAKVYKCQSCFAFDERFNKTEFDQSGNAYLWCDTCVKETNPSTVYKRMKSDKFIKTKAIKSVNKCAQIGFDILTELRTKSLLNYLLNEISLAQNQRRFALYLLDTNIAKQGKNKKITDQKLKLIGQILLALEQRQTKGFEIGLHRIWCFRYSSLKFAIVTETQTQISEQYSFYEYLMAQFSDTNHSLLQLLYPISVGICCLTLGDSHSFMAGKYNPKSANDSFDAFQSSNIEKASDWCLFAEKALKKAKKNCEKKKSQCCYRIYDDSQCQIVEGFDDY